MLIEGRSLIQFSLQILSAIKGGTAPQTAFFYLVPVYFKFFNLIWPKSCRYRIEHTNDNLTTLIIQAPSEADEGKFTCYAINREAKEAAVAGPDADVYIEERCSEGAQFCFKNIAIPRINNLWVQAWALAIATRMRVV